MLHTQFRAECACGAESYAIAYMYYIQEGCLELCHRLGTLAHLSQVCVPQGVLT
jgi:hypothetical protein